MNEEELSLDKYFAAVWRAKWLIIILVVAAGGIAAFLGLRQPTFHTSTALIQVGRVWKESLEDPYLTAEIANSAGFLQELGAKIGIRPNQLKQSVRAETVTVGPRRERYPILVRINATTESSEQSTQFAQTVADELIARHGKLFEQAMAPHAASQSRIEERLKSLASQDSPATRDLVIRLESELDQIRSNNTSPIMTEKTRLIGPVVKAGVTRPSIWRNVAVAALLAALAGIAIAALVAHFKPPQSKTESE